MLLLLRCHRQRVVRLVECARGREPAQVNFIAPYERLVVSVIAGIRKPVTHFSLAYSICAALDSQGHCYSYTIFPVPALPTSLSEPVLHHKQVFPFAPNVPFIDNKTDGKQATEDGCEDIEDIFEYTDHHLLTMAILEGSGFCLVGREAYSGVLGRSRP